MNVPSTSRKPRNPRSVRNPTVGTLAYCTLLIISMPSPSITHRSIWCHGKSPIIVSVYSGVWLNQ